MDTISAIRLHACLKSKAFLRKPFETRLLLRDVPGLRCCLLVQRMGLQGAFADDLHHFHPLCGAIVSPSIAHITSAHEPCSALSLKGENAVRRLAYVSIVFIMQPGSGGHGHVLPGMATKSRSGPGLILTVIFGFGFFLHLLPVTRSIGSID